MQADLYVCEPGVEGLGPTVLARYGEEGSHYSSMLVSILEPHIPRLQEQPATHTPGLLEAYRRYKERP